MTSSDLVLVQDVCCDPPDHGNGFHSEGRRDSGKRPGDCAPGAKIIQTSSELVDMSVEQERSPQSERTSRDMILTHTD